MNKLSDRVRPDCEAAPWVIEEIKKLEIDANRYRWLRKQQWYNSKLAVVTNPKQSVKLGRHLPSLDYLDEIIDTEIELENKL
jgi:hypothetical protein